MAVITPGSGGTLKSATLEGQILEIGTLLIAAQRVADQNPQNRTYLTCDTSNDNYLWNLNYNFPVTRTAIAGGGYKIGAEEYLEGGFTFAPGSGGTFSNPTSLGYLLDLIFYGQDKEKLINSNPNQLDYISGSLSLNTDLVTGSISLPIAPTIATDGKITWAVVPYLL